MINMDSEAQTIKDWGEHSIKEEIIKKYIRDTTPLTAPKPDREVNRRIDDAL
jgi:hypothetical protein